MVDCSKSARNEEPSSRGALTGGLVSADSGLQVNLEIALSGVSAKVKPPTGFQVGRKCVETSGDVIGDELTSTPDRRIWDLSPMRLGSRKRRQGNRRNRQMSLKRPGRACLLGERSGDQLRGKPRKFSLRRDSGSRFKRQRRAHHSLQRYGKKTVML